MFELSDQEMEALSQRIVAVICDEQLQMELIDHCCCCVEELMSQGLPFSDALDQSLLLLAPDGIHEIEAEVNRVLNPQIPTAMKTIMYFSGFIAAFCILLGLTMRMLHWPGADITLLCGDLALITSMFAVMITLYSDLRVVPRLTLVRSAAGSLGGVFIGTGSFFKIMHWPFANLLFVLGMLLVIFIFLPLLFRHLYQREMTMKTH